MLVNLSPSSSPRAFPLYLSTFPPSFFSTSLPSFFNAQILCPLLSRPPRTLDPLPSNFIIPVFVYSSICIEPHCIHVHRTMPFFHWHQFPWNPQMTSKRKTRDIDPVCGHFSSFVAFIFLGPLTSIQSNRNRSHWRISHWIEIWATKKI